MNHKVLLAIFCIASATTAMAFPPFKYEELKLTAEESSRIDGYYKKFNFLDVSRKHLLGEVKAASIGKYTSVCGEDTQKWQAYMGNLFSSTKYDEAIYAAIDPTNARESLVTHSTMMFREAIKSAEIRQDLDQLEANSTAQKMFFIYAAHSWIRSYAEPELTEVADKFLRVQCGVNKRASGKK